MRHLSLLESTSLVLLRTLIGWHFLYEGYYKLMLPGWSSLGTPLGQWSAAGYLKAASGPFAPWFHALAASGSSGWIDVAIPIALVVDRSLADTRPAHASGRVGQHSSC